MDAVALFAMGALGIPIDHVRRSLLGAGISAGGAALAGGLLSGCGGSDDASLTTSETETDTGSGTTGTTSQAGSCVLTATEVQGPYPLLAVLSNQAIVRQNITEDRTGIPLRLILTLQDNSNDCAPITDAAVYVWHCDKDGAYSGYSSAQNGDHSGEIWLRGIQLSDTAGQVIFDTIYPGWYAGRITHIHFQVYLNDNLQVTATLTSQLAFPQDVTTEVYDSSLYAAHGQNTSVSSFAQDNIFSDGTSTEMLSVTGNIDEGYIATLTVGVA